VAIVASGNDDKIRPALNRRLGMSFWQHKRRGGDRRESTGGNSQNT
jgi:hypothetical protein